jgi:membrane protease YdiL (CAAX protease family)
MGKVLFALWPVIAVSVGLIGMGSAWGAIALYHCGIVAALLGKPDAGRPDSRHGLHRGWALSAIPVGVTAFVSVRMLLPTLAGEAADVFWKEMPARLAAVGLEGAALPLFALYFITVQPLLEEVGWRGVLQRPEKGLRWEDAAFATYHLLVIYYLFPGAWILMGLSFVVLTTAAWFWRQLAAKTGGLQSVILQHAAADAGIIGAVIWSGTGY